MESFPPDRVVSSLNWPCLWKAAQNDMEVDKNILGRLDYTHLQLECAREQYLLVRFQAKMLS
jgi:hypothetical protein